MSTGLKAALTNPKKHPHLQLRFAFKTSGLRDLDKNSLLRGTLAWFVSKESSWIPILISMDSLAHWSNSSRGSCHSRQRAFGVLRSNESCSDVYWHASPKLA